MASELNDDQANSSNRFHLAFVSSPKHSHPPPNLPTIPILIPHSKSKTGTSGGGGASLAAIASSAKRTLAASGVGSIGAEKGAITKDSLSTINVSIGKDVAFDKSFFGPDGNHSSKNDIDLIGRSFNNNDSNSNIMKTTKSTTRVERLDPFESGELDIDIDKFPPRSPTIDTQITRSETLPDLVSAGLSSQSQSDSHHHQHFEDPYHSSSALDRTTSSEKQQHSQQASSPISPRLPLSQQQEQQQQNEKQSVNIDLDEDHQPYDTSNTYPNTGGRMQWMRLDCLELDQLGNVTERSLTRAELMQEARSAGPNPLSSLSLFGLPPRSTKDKVGSDGMKEDMDIGTLYEMLASTTLPADSRKAIHKTLRDYLRNSLQMRDIRQVDPAFVAKPALWVRHSAIVVSLDGLRAIILYNKMFIFDPGREESQELCKFARKCVIRIAADGDRAQPFEFNALEGILIFVAMRLEKEFDEFKPYMESYMHQLPNELNTKMLEDLRRMKQQLKQLMSRSNGVKNILENLLDDDDEMVNMYLSEQHENENNMVLLRDTQDHSEIEILLEAYLQVIDEIVNHADLLDDAIDDTEGLVMIHLDTLRNKLLTVELSMSVVTMMCTFGSVISGVFGMNFEIGLFDGNGAGAFWIVLASIAGIVSVPSLAILLILRRRGLFG